MSTHPNHFRYLTSLAGELSTQASRVRDLLGDTHWLTDGGHKEFLLIELLRRHIPCGMIASRGFVISETDSTKRSHEQDILIVDAMEEAPLFNQGGVIISFPRAIRAAISVKTQMASQEVQNSILVLNSVQCVVGPDTDPGDIWCGAYYFVESPEVAATPALVYGQIARGTRDAPITALPGRQSRLTPDCHASSSDFIFKTDHGTDSSSTVLRGYACSGLATALFLGQLLDHLAVLRGGTQSSFTSFSDGGVATPLHPSSANLTL
jgi:hypothetical protein